MPKLKLEPLVDERPVKVTLDLPAGLHRDLVAYGEALVEGGAKIEPVKLIVPMLTKFVASDRGFASIRRRKV